MENEDEILARRLDEFQKKCMARLTISFWILYYLGGLKVYTYAQVEGGGEYSYHFRAALRFWNPLVLLLILLVALWAGIKEFVYAFLGSTIDSVNNSTIEENDIP